MKKCFFISPIGDEESEARKHSDFVKKYIVEPVCKKYDYEVIRADEENTINKIDEDVLRHLDNDDLAIADLTGANPNVYYEAGYRTAKGLPIIYIAEKGTSLPFDVGRIRTQFFGKRADEVEDAEKRISKVIAELPDTLVCSGQESIKETKTQIDVDLISIYKMFLSVDSAYQYIFRFDICNLSEYDLFVKDIFVWQNGIRFPFEKESENVKYVETKEKGEVKKSKDYYSDDIPFKVPAKGIFRGNFYLYDVTSELNIEIGEKITLELRMIDSIYEHEYTIYKVKSWEKYKDIL